MLTARQEAKLNMYQVVQGYCAENSAIVDTNIAFKDSVTDFGVEVAAIDSGAQLVGTNLTGIAADKTVSRSSLTTETVTMAGRIYAYAAKIGNNTLKQAADITDTDLRRFKDGELAPACQAVHDLADANKVELADYGVTAPKLAALQALITAFAADVPKPRAAIAGRKTTREQIRQRYENADSILRDRMDRLVNDFAANNAEFVAGYFNARIIVDPKSKSKENGEGEEGGVIENP